MRLSALPIMLMLIPNGLAAAPRPPVSPPQPSIAPASSNPLKPNELQIPVLYVAVIFLVLDIALWNLPGARLVIAPFKLLTIGLYVFLRTVHHAGCLTPRTA